MRLPLRALAVALLGVALACTAEPRYPLVLQGGRVMDPASGLDTIADVAIQGGRIVAVSLTPIRGDTVMDSATYELPARTSVGIPHVLVNGVFVVRDGQPVTGVLPGRALRRVP